MSKWIQSWMPSANLDAQMAHLGWGAFIILAVSLAAARNGPLAHGLLASSCLLAFWIVAKEFLFDLLVEGDSVLESTVDAVFYIVGGGLGFLAYWWVA